MHDFMLNKLFIRQVFREFDQAPFPDNHHQAEQVYVYVPFKAWISVSEFC